MNKINPYKLKISQLRALIAVAEHSNFSEAALHLELSQSAVSHAIAQAEAAMAGLGRILVRASGTEPLIRVMVEAESADVAEHWTSELVQVVQQHLG